MRTAVTLISFVLFVYLVKVGTFGGGFDYCTGTKEKNKGYNYLVKLDPRGIWLARSRSGIFGITEAVPIGAFVGIAAIAPAIWLLRVSLPGKAQAGTCAKCGYDLRATPDRCPECGTVPKGSAR